jgi:hypothetical protein
MSDDYDGMSIEMLDSEILRLSNERAALRDRAKAATEARYSKLIQRQAIERLDAMTDEERAAMKALL